MFKNQRKRVSFLLSMVMLVAVTLSMFTMTASAETPNINYNPNTHTACFTYNIRQTAGNGTIRETVSKRANRDSEVVYSDDYYYSTTDWMQIYTSGNVYGYCRNDMVCPADRCFEVNTSAGLRIRSTPSTTAGVVCTVEDETFLQILSVVGGSDMSYVRVRTGVHEGKVGYVADNSYISEVNSDYAHG